MGDLNGLIQVITAVVILGGLVGVAYVGFKGSYNRARIEALREDNNDLRARVEDLDRELRVQKGREVAIETKFNALSKENELLKSMVLQRADVAQVGLRLDEHHDAAMQVWGEIVTLLRERPVT